MSDIDKDIEKVKELQSKIYEYGDYIYLNKNDKQAIENVLKELETYKKMCERLADILNINAGYTTLKKYCKCEELNCSDKEIYCIDCIINWARNEVENGNNSSSSN